MQLRRLELVGFKTFVDRTELEFHPGITAIVGPNGSGKSNIFDAIRWSLGETSARLLRGARMEDIIFAGSTARRPLGLARVALTLDNAAGLLPLDFSEVTVSRTVTRGGDGEYAINGVDCRLRDVQMLFLGTGLGGRSYALIGQGEVDAVLRATPIERRHWLEEAAGLARHKRQRVEAERRLERAQAHLDRLADLAGELDVQQQSLAVQADAAARHRTYTGELRDLEVALYADEARRLLGAMRRLTAQLGADRDQLAAASARVADAEAQVAAVEAQLADATDAFERGQQALLDGAETMQARAAEVQALDAQAESIRTRLSHVDGEIARLADEYASLSSDADDLGLEVESVERRRDELARALSAAEAALDAATADVEIAEARMAQARDEAQEVARAIAQSRSDLAALRARADLLGQAADAMARKAGGLAQAASRLAQERDAALRARDEAEEAARAADSTLDAAARDAATSQAALGAATEEVRAAELDEHRLRARLASMQEAAAQFVGFEEGVREVLVAAKANPARFPGLHGAVASLIDVPAGYRAAITAALGRRLHCLVFNARREIEAVLEYLQTEGRGGAAVLALDALRARHPAADPTALNAEVVARAVDVVTADSAVRAMVEALLGDVVITEHLAAAWRIFASGYHGRVVTRDGTLLSPDGVVSIPGRPYREVGPLGREQAIAELRRAVGEAEVRRQSAEARHVAVAATVAGADESVRAARADRERAAVILAERTQQLAQLDVEARRAAEEETAQAAESRAAAETVRGLEADIARLEADIEQLEAERQRLESILLDRQDGARSQTAARDAAMADLTAARMVRVECEASLQALRARMADRTAAMAEIEARRDGRVQQAEALTADLEIATARRTDASASYERLVATQAATKGEVERLAGVRVRLREDLSVSHAEHASAADAARAAEGSVHKTEVRAAQSEAELAAAASRLAEQYGITLEDAASRRLEGGREDARGRLEELRTALRELGPVNLRAIDEHAAVAARLDALRAHLDDLRASSEMLRGAIAHINGILRVRFRQTFEDVNEEFARLFQRLFEGGCGELELVEDEQGGEPGLEVIAQLPGKKRRPLVALSGGERVLVALALIFSMLRVHPSPFCIFDEVEAALDDANTTRFTALLRDLAQHTQVLIITHNKGTMAASDILYGVAMQEPGVSSLVSVRLVPSGNGAAPASERAPAREVASLPAE